MVANCDLSQNAGHDSDIPIEERIDQTVRVTGEVTFFKRKQGFGFIQPFPCEHVVPHQVMVYWKEIESEERWAYLTKGQIVEFFMKVEKKKGNANTSIKAVNVSLPGRKPVRLYDESERISFPCGNRRFTGPVKFYDKNKGFGYVFVVRQEGLPDNVPGEVRIEREEINSGTDAPRLRDGIIVEFCLKLLPNGVWSCSNLTKPGGEVINRLEVEGRQCYDTLLEGIIAFWRADDGFGYIRPSNTKDLPPEVLAKKRKDKEEVYFRRDDRITTGKFNPGDPVTFRMYTDFKGVGAYDIAHKEVAESNVPRPEVAPRTARQPSVSAIPAPVASLKLESMLKPEEVEQPKPASPKMATKKPSSTVEQLSSPRKSVELLRKSFSSVESPTLSVKVMRRSLTTTESESTPRGSPRIRNIEMQPSDSLSLLSPTVEIARATLRSTSFSRVTCPPAVGELQPPSVSVYSQANLKKTENGFRAESPVKDESEDEGASPASKPMIVLPSDIRSGTIAPEFAAELTARRNMPASVPVAAASRKDVTGSWKVDTSYVGVRTKDPDNIRRLEETTSMTTKAKNYDDPSVTKYELFVLNEPGACPSNVNPSHKEAYLHDEVFTQIFGMSRTEFLGIPKWKQQKLKKELNLF